MAKTSWYNERPNACHLVYLDKKSKELEKLLNHEKTMIIRGAQGKKSPLGGRAKIGETIYFVNTGGDLRVTHKGVISNVIESEKMTPEESIAFIQKYEAALNLSKAQLERWNGKKYLAVYEISDLIEIEPFTYNRTTNMDDWIILSDINEVKKLD